jgi:hypothetical protein
MKFVPRREKVLARKVARMKQQLNISVTKITSAMGFDDVLATERKTDHWNSLLRDVSITRIGEPDNKREIHRKLQDEQEVSYGLDSVYDLMDHVG